ncbi:unnamed protein product [marine sediment metagenome]|uniref:Uncharacterized protein n=1 Tax=marine sediment metagenome TaxID=412755 RepID=X1DXJ4_9ZZZZ
MGCISDISILFRFLKNKFLGLLFKKVKKPHIRIKIIKIIEENKYFEL